MSIGLSNGTAFNIFVASDSTFSYVLYIRIQNNHNLNISLEGIMAQFMESEPVLDNASSASVEIAPENIIGTKWVATGTFSKNRDTIEFVNMTYCIYTSINRLEPYTYRIRGNRILLGEHISYVIIDNVLFLNGYPIFTRE
jgi:hypothetical protein